MPLTATDPPAGQHYWWGTGRRKRAIARVRIRPGSGAFKVNGRDVDEFFTQQRDRIAVRQPLDATKMVESWDIWANASGGGYAGQAEAVRLGLARAIARAVPETDSPLRDRQLLTRDARKTERKKYGRRGARRSFQFSKR
ncbi:MAG: 30S ribosomal protein S9 [Phycisphaerae bacterium]|nr:30S ribosomal protein S9 [Phycisphaerae bacterium]